MARTHRAMTDRLLNFIEEHRLFSKDDRLLLAVSGGRDSMLLMHLLKQNGYHVSVAHCNFQLRGQDSDADEELVRSVCLSNETSFFVTKFDTKEYIENNKFSLQEAARKLRYNWFFQLCEEHNFTHLVTAHHKDDQAETILLNLLKGSKFRGFAGMKPKQGILARPLLCYNRQEIDKMVDSLGVKWREDVSNSKDYYHRNFIRNQVMPLLRQLNPSIEETIFNNSLATQKYIKLLDDYLEILQHECLISKGKYDFILIRKLIENEINEASFFEMIKKYGFNYTTSKNIFLSLNAQPGKIWETEHYELLKDRDSFIIRKRMERHLPSYQITEEGTRGSILRFAERELHVADHLIEKATKSLEIGTQNIQFPISLRPWQEADKLKLRGMKGHKKVSDLLTDMKLNRFDKEETFVIQNGDGQIINADFYRVSERFEPQEGESKMFIYSTQN